MPKLSEGKFIIWALCVFAIWLFVILPILYSNIEFFHSEEIFGVKRGEWLLFLATMGLWYATWRLVKGADATAERQLRAYMMVSKSEVRSFEVGKFPMPVVVLTNTGQTPAKDFTGHIGVGFVPFALDELPNIPKQNITSKSPVGPGQEKYLSVVFDMPLTQHQWDKIVAGTHCIRAFGHVDYVDIFGKSQTTKFNKIYGGSYGANMGFAMNDGPVGNDAT